jgi:integrase
MKQNKYSKLSSEPAIEFAPNDPPLVLYFKEDDGRLQEINLTFFVEGTYPRLQMAKACAEIFLVKMRSYSSASRTNFTTDLRAFNKFLDWIAGGDGRKHINTTLELSESIFIEFLAFLSINEDINKDTASNRYCRVTRFFTLMHMDRPQYLPENFKIPANTIVRVNVQHSRTENISLENLKLIAEVALREVNKIKEDHRRALDLLESASATDEQARKRWKPAGFWKSVANALYYMVKVEGIKSTSVINGKSMKKYSHPKPETVIGWYAPTSDQYFIPFLVLLYLRTAINVTSIFKLKRDCLMEHPLPIGLTICKFTKPRSGARSNKELGFPTNQPNGAIDLIRFLLEYTNPWIKHASRSEKNSLFLYRCRMGGIRSARHGFTQRSLRRFIARNNLPHFSWDQLRPSIATMIYLQTRDIFRVQRLLNHASALTTIKYIRGAIVQAQHNKEMSEGIDQMVEAVTGINHRENDISVFTQPVSDVVTAKIEMGELSPEAGAKMLKGGCRTLLGRCKNPLDSPQPGEIKGRVCRSLHACIFCENCWIFAEDLPETIRYRNQLETEKTEMTSETWEELHGEAVREINEAILASFPLEVVAKAELEAQQIQPLITR